MLHKAQDFFPDQAPSVSTTDWSKGNCLQATLNVFSIFLASFVSENTSKAVSASHSFHLLGCFYQTVSPCLKIAHKWTSTLWCYHDILLCKWSWKQVQYHACLTPPSINISLNPPPDLHLNSTFSDRIRMCQYILDIPLCGHSSLYALSHCYTIYNQLQRINRPQRSDSTLPFEMPEACCPRRRNVTVRELLEYCSAECSNDGLLELSGYRRYGEEDAVFGPEGRRRGVGWR